MNLCYPTYIEPLTALCARYGFALQHLPVERDIPGSYWGAPEAGLIGTTVYVRDDTPLHSALHELAHLICMDEARRAQLHTNAGGEFCEEDAVCYLQILLAGQLGLSMPAICADMDEWGYTFRLGSAQAWFAHDAEDARAWLAANRLIDRDGIPTGRYRRDTSAAA